VHFSNGTRLTNTNPKNMPAVDYCISYFLKVPDWTVGNNVIVTEKTNNFFNNTHQKFSSYVAKSGSSYGYQRLNSNKSLENDTWYHIVQSAKGNKFELYIDGTKHDELEIDLYDITYKMNTSWQLLLGYSGTEIYLDKVNIWPFACETL
jgi:hypothetical protein